MFIKRFRPHSHSRRNKSTTISIPCTRTILSFFLPRCFVTTFSLTIRHGWLRWRKIIEIREIRSSYVFLFRKFARKLLPRLQHKPQIKMQMRLLSLLERCLLYRLLRLDSFVLSLNLKLLWLFRVDCFLRVLQLSTPVWTSRRSLWTGFLVNPLHEFYLFSFDRQQKLRLISYFFELHGRSEKLSLIHLQFLTLKRPIVTPIDFL